MSDESSESLIPFASVGGVAVLGAVACCVGLKAIGGVILFSGLAATISLTTDQTTFVGGLLFAGVDRLCTDRWKCRLSRVVSAFTVHEDSTCLASGDHVEYRTLKFLPTVGFH